MIGVFCRRTALMLLLLSLYVCIVSRTSADNVLKVLEPMSLVRKVAGPITELGTALFGIYEFGKELSAPAFYSMNNSNACSAIFYETMPDQFILVADRGECTFAEKVLHAQTAGAIAVLVLDNKDKWYQVYMGSSHKVTKSISIPSLLVSKQKGKLIQESLTNKQPVQLSMSFDIIDKRNEVDIQLFSNSFGNEHFDTFVEEFSPVAELLSKEGTVHFELFFDMHTKWRANDESCVFGKYCIYKYSNTPFSNMKEVLAEMLRQLCIVDVDWPRWWEYSIAFKKECVSKVDASESCSRKVCQKVGLDYSKVSQCVSKSGGYDSSDSSKTNSLLEKNMRVMQSTNFWRFPQLIVNSAEFMHGDFRCPQVDVSTCGPFSFVCSAHLKVPQICLSKNDCPAGQFVDACGDCLGVYDHHRIDDANLCPSTSSKGASVGVVIAITLAICLALGIILIVYLNYRHRQNRLFLSNRMSQYVSIDDASDFAPRQNSSG